MNISCIICSDLLTPRSEIHSTSCGHLFHQVCLMQWIEQSRTCPTCRHRETDKSIHKVYLNVPNSDNIKDDAITLQSKLDSANFKLSLRDAEITHLKESSSKSKTKVDGLREMVRKLEEDIRVHESSERAFKEQIKYFKSKASEIPKYIQELEKLKKEVKNFGHLQTVLSGSQEQLDDMLHVNKDPTSLSLLMTALKKELISTDQKKQQLSSKVVTLGHDIFKVNGQKDKLLDENSRLKALLKESEEQRRHLKKKLAALCKSSDESSSTTSSNQSLERIILESPAPKPIDLDEAVIDLTELNSPTVDERVHEIKDSDSPYLTLKPSSSGISNLLNTKYKSLSQTPVKKPCDQLQKFAMFKATAKTLNKEFSYNGLGGHSKEDRFPTPSTLNGPLKRAHSSSSLRPSKFKKLAPGGTLKR